MNHMVDRPKDALDAAADINAAPAPGDRIMSNSQGIARLKGHNALFHQKKFPFHFEKTHL
jgi:hypothetical protein